MKISIDLIKVILLPLWIFAIVKFWGEPTAWILVLIYINDFSAEFTFRK